jgi:hypothetical protein
VDGRDPRGHLDEPKAVRNRNDAHLEAGGGITLDEVFWAWEPDRRVGFSVTAASIGWLSGLSEVYEITPLSSERCKLRWVVAASFPGMLGKIEPGIASIFHINQRRLVKKLERVARERVARERPTPA